MFMGDMTYDFPWRRTVSGTQEFAKILFTLRPVWQESLNVSLGISHDVQLSNFAFEYNMKSHGCGETVFVYYPGMETPELGDPCSHAIDQEFVNATTLVKFEGMNKRTQFLTKTLSHVDHGETGYMGLMYDSSIG